MPTPAQIVTEDPRAAQVLHRYDIEFCCEGGREELEVICERRGLDYSALLAEITAATATDAPDWNTAPLADLVEHILVTHHRPLDTELPRLQHLTATVLSAHPDQGVLINKLKTTLDAIVLELTTHMPKEEQILFPLIVEGRGHLGLMPMKVMERDHLVLGELLDELRALTNNFTPPEGVCPTWKALWAGLDALTEDLHIHVHLEEHILFPRARTAGPQHA
jgi:regulator of cell morphogenesis and NO signaling